MTATNFRDLLDPWTLFVAGDGHSGLRVANPDEILALPVPWVDCPTCVAKGWPPHTGSLLAEHAVCPACTGTGKATVAQLLAWGSAVATDPNYTWDQFTSAHEAVEDYRNRILDVQP